VAIMGAVACITGMVIVIMMLVHVVCRMILMIVLLQRCGR
jgi:hypothetical protein